MRPTDELVAAVLAERQRQFDLPGTEHDVVKGPNDWITTISTYLIEAASRSGEAPTQQDFDKAIVKTMAVALAALQHSDLMRSKNRLT